MGAVTAPHDTDDVTDESGSWLVVVSGWTGAGKSTLADGLAHEFDATVVSFDWVMSGLRALPEVWDAVETPVELQRRVGWNLLSRVAEQQLRRGASCILDLVAREEPRLEWETLARRYGARFGVIECICSDEEMHRSRVDRRDRAIPGWYELDWDQVAAGRERYEPLNEPKLVLDATSSASSNLAAARQWLRSARMPGSAR